MKRPILLSMLLSILLCSFVHSAAAATKLSRAKTPRVDPVCVSSHINGYTAADADRQTTLMQQGGINWVRFDFQWILFEPTQGTYDYSNYDALVNQVNNKGMHPIAVLDQYALPVWQRQDSNDYLSPPKDFSQYAKFVKNVVSHYKGKIRLYEAGNEPNIDIFWPPAADVVVYSAFLKAVYSAVKSGDSSAKVISAGLSAVNDPTYRDSWIHGMFDNGVGGYLDYFGYHPYTWPRGPDDTTFPAFSDLAIVRQIIQSYGYNYQLMATEDGWPSTIASGGVDEATQAQYIGRVYQKIEYESFKYVAIYCDYEFIDGGTDPTNPGDNFGMVRDDFSTKPSYTTIKNTRTDYDNHFTPINP